MGLLDKIKSTIGLDGEKRGVSERIEPIVNGALYRGGDGRENTFRRIEPSDHFTDRWKAWDRMLDKRYKKLGEDYPEVKRELVEIIKEAGVAEEEEGIQYEKLDAPKLDSRVQKLLEMSPEEQAEITDTRTAALLNQLNNAEFGLYAATFLDLNKDDEKYVKEFKRDKKHAEHGLTNIVKGKTLESEVTAVLKMGSKARHEYYTEVLKSGGRKAVDELTSAVKKQRTKSNALEM